LLVLNVDPHERARIFGLIYALMIAAASPFGWIAGWLSELNRALPFVLNVILYVICALALYKSKAITGGQAGSVQQKVDSPDPA
jgi:hypothetical protein